MARRIIQILILTVALVLAQTLIFNHVSLFGVAVPFVFIYIIIRLSMATPLNYLMTLAFLTGLCVDVFSDTLGMNALACTIIAVLKKPILLSYCQRDDSIYEITPTISTLGFWVYSKYMFSMTLVYCLIYFAVEYFSVSYLWDIFINAVSSSVLTYALLLGIDSLLHDKREKRL